jgi:hypothetical protein
MPFEANGYPISSALIGKNTKDSENDNFVSAPWTV